MIKTTQKTNIMTKIHIMPTIQKLTGVDGNTYGNIDKGNTITNTIISNNITGLNGNTTGEDQHNSKNNTTGVSDNYNPDMETEEQYGD